MNPDTDKSYIRVHKTVLLVALLTIGAVVFGWVVGRSGRMPDAAKTETTSQPVSEASTKATDVSSLVGYTLPDGWKEVNCEDTKSVYIAPRGATADCNSNPISAVKLSVDAANSTDCNQLQNVSDVKKHVCISLFINGKKTLKATTEYLASSSYNKETTIESYYFDTGKGVVKADYLYNSDNQYQAEFEQFAQTLTAK